MSESVLMTSAADDSASEPEAKPSAVDEGFEIAKTIFYALAIALVLRILLFQPFTIPSASMEPTLLQGDYIIVSKFSYGYSRHSIPFSPPIFKGRTFGGEPQRGDVVVFKLPRDGRTDYIKRLIGLPGDRVQVRDGALIINGKPIQRQQLSPMTQDTPMGITQVERYRETLPNGRAYVTNDFGAVGRGDTTGVYTVPAGCYFFMGDNRDNSSDSRFNPGGDPSKVDTGHCGWNESYDRAIGGFETGVGFVARENLVGKAQIILLSWNAKASLFKPWTWFLDARPSRFFRLLK